MNEKKPRKSGGEVSSWILTLILLRALPPLGIICLLSKLLGNDFLRAFIVRIRDYLFAPNNTEKPAAASFAPPQVKQYKKRSVSSEKQDDDGANKISRGKLPLLIFGWILLTVGIVGAFEPAFNNGAIWRLFQYIAVALGGAGMLVAAHTKKKKEQLYSSCMGYVGERPYIELMPMASALGLKRKELIHSLDDMISRGYLGDGAYIDRARDIVVIDSSKLPDDVIHDMGTDPDEVIKTDKYDLLLMEIRRASVRIKDEVMTEKTDTIGSLTASIFAAVRENPEKLRSISSFLNYYLPTTLKLLNTYADFEEQGFQGENMSKSKERIEEVTDTLIAAYTKQLDSLFLSDSMDVDSDIDVLETMIKRDGLSGSDFGTGGTAV